MFSFFRKSQDSKKVTVPEREADGFVIVGKRCFSIKWFLPSFKYKSFFEEHRPNKMLREDMIKIFQNSYSPWRGSYSYFSHLD